MTPLSIAVRLAFLWTVLSQAVSLTSSLIICREDKDSLIKRSGYTRLGGVVKLAQGGAIIQRTANVDKRRHEAGVQSHGRIRLAGVHPLH